MEIDDPMRFESRRLDTFRQLKWPSWSLISCDKLAKAGFYYSGVSDEVICFSCGGKRRGWRMNEKAIAVHAVQFPLCPFVLGDPECGNVPMTNFRPTAAPLSAPPVQSDLIDFAAVEEVRDANVEAAVEAMEEISSEFANVRPTAAPLAPSAQPDFDPSMDAAEELLREMEQENAEDLMADQSAADVSDGPGPSRLTSSSQANNDVPTGSSGRSLVTFHPDAEYEAAGTRFQALVAPPTKSSMPRRMSQKRPNPSAGETSQPSRMNPSALGRFRDAESDERLRPSSSQPTVDEAIRERDHRSSIERFRAIWGPQSQSEEEEMLYNIRAGRPREQIPEPAEPNVVGSGDPAEPPVVRPGSSMARSLERVASWRVTPAWQPNQREVVADDVNVPSQDVRVQQRAAAGNGASTVEQSMRQHLQRRCRDAEDVQRGRRGLEGLRDVGQSDVNPVGVGRGARQREQNDVMQSFLSWQNLRAEDRAATGVASRPITGPGRRPADIPYDVDGPFARLGRGIRRPAQQAMSPQLLFSHPDVSARPFQLPSSGSFTGSLARIYGDELAHVMGLAESSRSIGRSEPLRTPLELLARQQLDSMNIFTDKAERPDMASFGARLQTFNQWPTQKAQSATDMATAGFYFSSDEDDAVKCFQCDVTLHNWLETDDPWVEHARWSKRCQFVLVNKGNQFFDSVKEKYAAKDAAANDCEGMPRLKEEKPPSVSPTVPRTLVQLLGRNIDTTAEQITQALSFGYEEKLIVAAIVANGYRLFPSVVEMIDRMELIRTTPEVKGKEPSPPRLSDQPSTSSGPMRSIHPQFSSVEAELHYLREQRMCKICMDAEVSVVFLPCGHLVSCPQCAPALQLCPICRVKVKAVVRSFAA